MTVREVIEKLSTAPDPDMEVILAADPEGNHFWDVEEVEIDALIDGDLAVIIWP